MDEEIERLVVSVRADTAGFARDVADMRAAIDGPLARGAETAGRGIENALLRAVRTGRLGFEDLGRIALSVLNEIAASAVRAGLDAILGGGGGRGGGGGAGGLFAAIGGLLGLPGRATGGPVAPGRAYLVGERGPELFVPTASGQVVPGGSAGRALNIAITIAAPADTAPQALAQSSRQLARAVRAALDRAD
ncbi:tail tape measure protein [Sphingomonas sp.]|uniref:tail tape measure protein n=1 Tax=Sphingomonas sp. TaxID=28214 RepID=UPI001DBEDE7F|nr:tail tape measure protein [Sphingomonas sp.]MBX9796090.1 tail tape measure protein [Sphingomonas sp.]